MSARQWQPTAILDATRIGGASYSSADLRAVTQMVGNTSGEEPLGEGIIALSTGVEGRAVRQILQDLDARVLLVGKRASGVFVCRYADEGDSMQRALESSWRTPRARCRLRLEYIAASGMERRQLIFEGMDSVELDDDDLDDD